MLDRVVLAGPDDKTSIESLLDLSTFYSFVEWAVLYSPTREGTTRYPSKAWRHQFEEACQGTTTKRAVHLCGQGVHDYVDGNLPASMLSAYQRIQINVNLSTKKWQAPGMIESLVRRCKDTYYQTGVLANIVMQENHNNAPYLHKFEELGTQLHILYDASGGHGKELVQYAGPWKGHYTGYAGVIGPENCEAHAKTIGAMYPQHYWLDMESRIRNDQDEWDHTKVVDVLRKLKPFII